MQIGIGIGAGNNIASASGGATAPVPLMLMPKAGDSIDADVGNVYLHAVAPSGAPAVSSVEFFEGSTSLGTVASEPYAMLLTGVTAGSKSYTAKFNYASGPSPGTSAAVALTVNAADTYDPSTKVDGWFDPTDNGTITLTSGLVSAITNKGTRTGAITSSFGQSTSTRRPKLLRWRGRQCLHFGANSGTEQLNATSSSTAQPTVCKMGMRGLEAVSQGVCMSGGTTARVRLEGTTYPRTAVLNAGASISKALADQSGHFLDALADATDSISVDGSATTGNASTGNWGTPITWGASSTPSSPQAGAYGDYILNLAALGGTDNTNINTWYNRRWGLTRSKLLVHRIGDSITLGNSSTDVKGFRSKFWLVSGEAPIRGVWVESVGSVEGKGFPDDCHNGHSGEDIAYIVTNVLPLLGVQYFPNIVDLMIGTNNVRAETTGKTWVAGTGAGSTYESWYNLCVSILTALPSAHLIVNTIPPINDGTYNPRAIEFNGNITSVGYPALLAAYPGRVWYSDVNTAQGGPSYNGTYSADGVHPNDTGYTNIEKCKRTPLARAIATLAA